MKMYDVTVLAHELGIESSEVLERAGVVKAFAIRHALVKLKHEVKATMKAGYMTINVGRLNERLQHIAKLPRPGLPKVRCNRKCRCAEPLT
jgi:hypothetical protein